MWTTEYELPVNQLELSQRLASTSEAVERSVLKNPVGVGYCVQAKFVTRAKPTPILSHGTAAAQFWSQCGWLARKAHWDQLQDLDVLQSYWTGAQSEFQTFMDDLPEAEGSNRTDKIQSHAQQQLSAARKEEHKLRSAEYKLWLCEAQQTGMMPLFKAIRNREEVAQRPRRQASLEVRPFLRLSHWHKIWRRRVDGPQTNDHPRKDERRQKAQKQTLEIPEISFEALAKSFRRKRKKAGGPDLWTYEVLNNLLYDSCYMTWRDRQRCLSNSRCTRCVYLSSQVRPRDL